ncbi:hypothetical protein Ddye_024804 [Dipteronia dyeriana]|uniref:Uncharacterized protein n=1 Tax=Dipteronia dyeriana TaxID=168575 RepID=A0AAD9TW43_9ROSI|nr:hypothetical protein Ddye_024804 [Dipteronia dyeriana]
MAGGFDIVIDNKGAAKQYPGKLTWYVRATCIVAALGGLIFGYDLGISGDLKTVSGKEAEDQRETLKLVTKLANTLETKKAQHKENKTKFNETSTSVDFRVFCVFSATKLLALMSLLCLFVEKVKILVYFVVSVVVLLLAEVFSATKLGALMSLLCLFVEKVKIVGFGMPHSSEEADIIESDLEESRSRSRREKAQPLALENYVNRSLVVKERPEPATKPISKPASKSDYREVYDHRNRYLVVKDRPEPATKPTSKSDYREVCDRENRYLVVKDRPEPATKPTSRPASKSHYIEDYYAEKIQGDKPYGWVARDDDYKAKSLGSHFQKIGDLKTVSEKEVEDQRKIRYLRDQKCSPQRDDEDMF